MNKETMKKYLNELNTFLKEEDLFGEICIFGGSYITLMYKDDRMTDDIDSIFIKGKKQLLPLIKKVAQKYNISMNWLNDAVKETVEMSSKLTKNVYLAFSNLTIYTPPPQFILAMKVMSTRAETKDFEDIKVIVKALNIKTVKEIENILKVHFPHKVIDYRNRIFLEELIKDVK